jgi:L-ascorbate metabolism protein UlaG (beta-lactamase superfamily)
VTAAKELGAKRLMPVHWAKFALSIHDWNEPIERASIEAKKQQMELVTPLIGQKVDLNGDQEFSEWWKLDALQPEPAVSSK